MKLTKSLLQSLIKEEKVRLHLRSRGYEPTLSQIHSVIKNLDEGFFDSFKKSTKDLSSVVASLGTKIKDLRDSLAKKLKSKEKKIVDDEALAAAESAMALGFAKEFSKIGDLKAAEQMQQFIKDQSSVYPLIKDLLPSSAAPMKTRGKGPGYGVGRSPSAGGAFAVGESKEILRKFALEVSAKHLIRELQSEVTSKKVLKLVKEDLVDLNEGLFDSFLNAEVLVSNFYNDAIKKLAAAGSEKPEDVMLSLFSSLDPQKYDIELFGAEVQNVGPSSKAPSRASSKDMTADDALKRLDLPSPSDVRTKKSDDASSAVKPPVKAPSQDMVFDYKSLAKYVNKKKGSETFYSKQLADVLFDVEQGEIPEISSLSNRLNQIKDELDLSDDPAALKKFDDGSKVFFTFFKKHPDAFRKVADESLPDILGENRRRMQNKSLIARPKGLV